ncbi:HtaA domain-containing protein [Dermacoccaceae bacterium W4C1]
MFSTVTDGRGDNHDASDAPIKAAGSTGATRIQRRTTAYLITAMMTMAMLLPGFAPAPAAADTTTTYEGVTFEWAGSAEWQARPPNGSKANYMSVGVSDGTQATYSASKDGFRIVQRTKGGSISPATWDTRGAHVGTEGTQLLQMNNGVAVQNSDGSATIQWQGSFSVNFYDGLVPFTVTNPRMTISDKGVGTLRGDLSGYAGDMADPNKPKEKAPSAANVVIANFSGVKFDAKRFVVTPAYAGVRTTAPSGQVEQDTSQTNWGSWPQSMVDFQGGTGLAAYFYSTGGSADKRKAPASFAIGFTQAGVPSTPTDPGDDDDNGGGTDNGGDNGGTDNGGDTGGTDNGGDTGGTDNGGNTGGTDNGGNTGGTDNGGNTGGTDNGGNTGGTDNGGSTGGNTGGSTGGTNGGSSSATVAGELAWGVKKSFRNYITGPIAKGRVDLNGANYSGEAYRFGQQSTTWNAGSTTSTTNYGGGVRFYGHGGILNVSMSNPQVRIESASRATLLMQVNGKSTSIASLNLGSASKRSLTNGISYSSVPVTLSSAGAKVFSYNGGSFYEAGTVMDPLSFVIGKKASGTGGSGSAGTPGNSSTGNSNGGSTGGSGGTGGSTDNGGTAAPSVPITGNGGSNGASGTTSSVAGQLAWGVKSSFRSYITGPIAKGRIDLNGASYSGNAFRFGQRSTTWTSGSASSTTSYGGGIRFYGHSGILNISMSNPQVRIESASRATLLMQVNGRSTDIANLNLGSAAKRTVNGGVSYSGVPATLSSSGARVFSYGSSVFYPAGTAMDPLSFVIGAASSGSGGGATTGTVGGSGAGSTGSTDSEAIGSLDPTIPNSGTSAAGVAAAPVKTAGACAVSTATLNWGFKESFRSYISGSIANGEWVTSGGAKYATPEFSWAGGKGTYNGAKRTGDITFAGSVKFTGHDGLLNTTISNPRIRIQNAKTADLILDVSGVTMDDAMAGKNTPVVAKQIVFATLDMSNATVSVSNDKKVIRATAVPTKITAAGYKTFPNYPAGTAFDPISFSVTVPQAQCAGTSAAAAKSSAPTDEAAPAAAAGGGNTPSDTQGTSIRTPLLIGGGLAVLLIGVGAGAIASMLMVRRRLAALAPITGTSDLGGASNA